MRPYRKALKPTLRGATRGGCDGVAREVKSEARMRIARLRKTPRIPVKIAWVLRRRAVCRYTKTTATTTVTTGRMSVEATNRSGADSPLSEENFPRMIAIEAPEPTTAETNEAISTSFRRIPSDPFAVGCENPGLFEAVFSGPHAQPAWSSDSHVRRQEYHTPQAKLCRQFGFSYEYS